MTTDADAAFGAPLDRRVSVRDTVSARLRSALVAGRMVPGRLYSAPQLAEMLGVSATPVREAMLDLVREQMVEVVRNKGFRVLELDDAKLDELVEVRRLLEVPTMAAVAAACEGEIAERVRELDPLAERIERAAEDGDLEAFITHDTRFHVSFLSLHGNASLVDVVREMRGRSRLYGLERLDRATLVATAGEHRAMVRLALDRDADGLAALVEQHIGHIRREWASAPGGPPTGSD
jgi:DNA-binding GntR family transcriptional regulator